MRAWIAQVSDLLSRRRAPRPGPLVSADGAFRCTPDHAVELAYMLSTAEAAIGAERDQLEFDPTSEIAFMIGEYLNGRMSPDEVIQELRAP